MNPLPISMSGLRGRAVRMDDHLIPAAAMFPLFDRAGSVRSIMLLTSDTGQIVLLPWRPGLVRVPLWGPIRLAGRWTSLRGVTDEAIAGVEGLWHFDPWWMLKDDRFAGHWSVGPLKTTNCAGRFKRPVRILCFRRDLSRIVWMVIKEGNETSTGGWEADVLPDPETPAAATAAPNDEGAVIWRFDPIWARWTAS